MANAEFYAASEREILTAISVEEAVIEYLEETAPDKPPKTLTVQGFVPRKIAQRYFDRAFETLEEELAEEYGNPEDGTYLPDSVRELWTGFTEKVRHDYKVWSCEEFGESVEIETAPYLEEAV